MKTRKIKLIDMLDEVAQGKMELPKILTYKGQVYEQDSDEHYCEYIYLMDNRIKIYMPLFDKKSLNEEIEIGEE